MQNVIPTLTEGIIEVRGAIKSLPPSLRALKASTRWQVCKVKPEDPIDYLAEYLFKNSPEENE